MFSMFSEEFMKLFTIVCFIYFITIIEVFVIRAKDMLSKSLVEIQLYLATILLIVGIFIELMCNWIVQEVIR